VIGVSLAATAFVHLALFRPAGIGEAAPLQARLEAILDRPALKGALVAAVVAKEDGTLVFARSADTRLVPASNQKLLSVAYALHTLGPDWRPVTSIWSRPDRWVIDCPGDPSLRSKSLTEIPGRTPRPVYARQGYRVGVPPTWENDDLPHRYAPRITALTVDRGAFTLVNENGTPRLEPSAYGVRIMQFAGGPVRTEFDPFGNVMVVRGDLPKEKKNLENFAIPEPDRAAASILGGPLFAATSLPAEPPDHRIEGDMMSKMAKDCLVPSDNYLAECLMLLAAAKEGPLGENPYGVAPNRMRDFLVKTVGLSRDEARPMDGSGMSRHNLVTARGIAKLLAWSLRQPTAALWLDSMAKPGAGTLANRLKESTFLGKTGSLNSVSTLSGYVRGPGGERLIVSLLMNHFLGAASEARMVQDDFVREIEKPALLSHEPVSLGAVFGGRMPYAGDLALSKHRAPHGDRVP
jgi:serine-type D-Ala-D-Ala carboxypeptidase/endopeptidase (penicillin-binding protein 4)